MGVVVSVLQGKFGRATLLQVDHPVTVHAHPHFNVLLKVGGPGIAFRVGHREYELRDDNLLLINPWQPHANLFRTGEEAWLISLLINPCWRPPGLDRWHSRRRFEAACAPRSADVDRLAARLAELMRVLAAPEVAVPVLCEFMATIIRDYSREATAPLCRREARPSDFRIQRAVAFIRQNPSKQIRSEEIASAAGLSRSRFFDRFRECLGVPPQCFLDWVCMDAAIAGLNEGKPVATVSGELGFSAPSHFSRFFKLRTGVAPAQFRACVHRTEAENRTNW